MQYVPGHGFVGEPSSFRISKENLLAGAVLGGSIVAAGVYLYVTSGSSSKTEVRTAGVPGLANLGNTCYANALLQGLSSVPCVVQWLKDVETSGEDPTKFLVTLKDIVLKLNTEESCLYNAGGVVTALIAKGWQIGIGVEHDLHELFNVFLATGDEELRTIRRNSLRTSLIDVAEENSTLSPTVAPSTPLKQLIFDRCAETVRMDARLRAPFFGLTATQLRCCDNSCGFKKVRYDSCSVISVQIPKTSADRTVTLELLLRKYFCMEVIRGASCDECKKRTGRVDSGLFKKQGFSKLPQCLVIRVERGAVMPSGAIFKISDHVEFGETLDVRDLCFYRNKEDEYERMMKRNEASRLPEVTSRIVGGAERETVPLIRGRSKEMGLAAANICTIDGGSFVAERREAARYRYQLRAVSEHRGIPETGHFVTYRRGVTDPHSWYLTNDDQVTRVPYSKVAACEAYMLYYERIQPSRWHRTPSYSLVPNLSL